MRAGLLLLCGVMLGGCAAGTDLARSCGGERVLECDPYEWSGVLDATFTPNIPIGDPTVRPQVTVTLETCGATTPLAPTVQIQALLGSGDSVRVLALTTVRAESPDATSIDVVIDNPFSVGGSVPPNTDVTLRFVPVVGGCDGDAFELPYRTGPVIRP